MRFLYTILICIIVTYSSFAQEDISQINIPKEDAPKQRYFYTGKDYGSEALFNPLSLMINGGYDITQLQSVSNRFRDHQFARMAKVVFKNLTHPIESINHYGWPLFLRTEFLPISFKKDEMQWIPNYQQHLFGCGMLYTKMKEWYEDKNVPVPWLFSSVTLMSQHLLNEIMESGPNEGWSVDEISDIYVFDLGGILLFSFDSVNEFFSKTLVLSDWSLQAAVTLPEGRVNAGQYFALKWKLPFTENYSFFYRFGMGALFGLSKNLNPEDAVSFGVGFRSKHLVELNHVARQRTIETSWHAGAFYDKNNSLMASLVFSGVKEFFCMADVYPGIIKYKDFSPGIWAVFGLNGNVTMGLSTRYAIGLGFDRIKKDE